VDILVFSSGSFEDTGNAPTNLTADLRDAIPNCLLDVETELVWLTRTVSNLPSYESQELGYLHTRHYYWFRLFSATKAKIQVVGRLLETWAAAS
jgi:hypothetical protein